MLFPAQAQIDAPVLWQIGRAGERPDVHPGKILDLTTTTVTNRTTGEVRIVPAAICVFQMTARPENGGHKYLTVPLTDGLPRAIPTSYLWPRPLATRDGESLLIEGLDDLDPEEVQQRLMEDNAKWLEAGGSASGGLAARAEAKADAKEALASV